MHYILEHIDSFAALHPILPAVLKFGLIILVCLVAYLPLSLLAWTLSLSFRKALTLFEVGMSRVATKAHRLSTRLVQKAKNLLEQHYMLNTTFASFDDIRYQFSGHSVQNALDDLTKFLQEAPIIFEDKEAQKYQLVQQVKECLENLGGGISLLKNLDIPEMVLDREHVIRKKNALSSLLLFIPLLLAVILVNTFLLNAFFDELMGGREIFDYVPYSIVIALMFTFIECGSGVAIGFQEKEKERSQYSSGNYILSIFCWFIVAGLAFVELFLYLLVGTSEEYDRDEIIKLIFDGDYSEILFAGGWLSILGPSIVFALYVFGHRVSTGYYDFSKENDFERFKKDLDKRFSLYTTLRSSIDETTTQVNELVRKIKNENIELNQATNSNTASIEKFKIVLDNQISRLADVISRIAELEVPTPEIQIQKLSLEDSKSLHRSNLIFLVILLASLVMATLSIPNTISFGHISLSGIATKFMVSLLFLGMSVISGMMLTTKVTILNTTNGQLAKLVLERHNTRSIVTSLGILLIVTVLLYFIYYQSGIFANIIPFFLCLLCVAGGFFSGKNLIQAIGSWYVTVAVLWLYIKSTFAILICFSAYITSKIALFIVPVLDSFSFPIRFIFRRV